MLQAVSSLVDGHGLTLPRDAWDSVLLRERLPALHEAANKTQFDSIPCGSQKVKNDDGTPEHRLQLLQASGEHDPFAGVNGSFVRARAGPPEGM